MAGYIIWDAFYTVANVPYGSLLSLISDDVKDRASLSAWRSIGSMLGNMVPMVILPFLIWNGKRKTPAYILFLGKYLPYSIMGMLVVYCLKGVQLTIYPHGLPEFLAVAAVVLLHLWKKNTLNLKSMLKLLL